MRQAQKKKEKDKIAVALMLCFCVIALTSIFTIKANIDKINGEAEDVPVSEKSPTKESLPDDDELDAPTVSAQTKVPTVESESPKSYTPEKKTEFINPVKSSEVAITNEYSMDSLIYSVTLDQYMTHCGIDIEAPADSQVVSTSAGTVTAVYSDDRYGKSVEITHDNDFVTIYSNLSTNEMVETGDTVTQGQVIGGVGSTGLFEASEPAHLHLEMLKGGVYVNPADYIKFS